MTEINSFIGIDIGTNSIKIAYYNTQENQIENKKNTSDRDVFFFGIKVCLEMKMVNDILAHVLILGGVVPGRMDGQFHVGILLAKGIHITLLQKLNHMGGSDDGIITNAQALFYQLQTMGHFFGGPS